MASPNISGNGPQENTQQSSLLYLPAGGLQAIAAYSVDVTTGATQALPGSPHSTGSTGEILIPLSKDRQSRFLYFSDAANYPYGYQAGANDVNGFAIAADGTLQQIPGLPMNNDIGLASVSPDGRFVYVGAGGGFGLEIFAVDQSSRALSLSATVPFAPSTPDLPFSYAITPDGRFMIVLVGEQCTLCTSSTLSVYSLDANTGLPSASAVSTVNIPGSSWMWPVIDPSGHLIFLPNLGSSQNVAVFSLAGNGTLTAVPGSPFDALPEPDFLTVDSSSQWLFAASSYGPGMSAFRIEASGALTPVAEPAVSNSIGGMIAFDPTGTFLYRLNGDAISGFRLDATTGLLSPL